MNHYHILNVLVEILIVNMNFLYENSDTNIQSIISILIIVAQYKHKKLEGSFHISRINGI
jgi:hypothetical protein